MTQDLHDKMLERVRALLAKAEDRAATEEESKLYTAKAAELMAKYSINQALIDAARPRAEREVVGDRVVLIVAPYAFAKASLLHTICRYSRVKSIRINTGRYSRRTKQPGTQQMHLFGFAADLEQVEMLYTSLLLQVAWFGKQAKPPGYLEPGEKRVWHREWLFGFSHGVGARLKEAEERAKKTVTNEQGGNLLPVLLDRSTLVADRLKAHYPDMTTTKISFNAGAGYQAGRLAANQADLGGTRIDKQKLRKLGSAQ